MSAAVPQGAGAADQPSRPGKSYRDRLASRGIHPVVIHRTEKRPGDKVLRSWALPVEVVRERDA